LNARHAALQLFPAYNKNSAELPDPTF